MESTDRALTAQMPVFPLPDTVLFPGVVLPLHVFEPRYRAMISDALAEDGHLVIAMAHADGQGGHERIADVGCAGRIIHADMLDGGEYNILVHGVDRVRLVEEVHGDKPYRRFRAQIIPKANHSALATATEELARLQSSVLNLSSAVAQTDQQLVEVLRSTSDPVELVDILCAVLVSEPRRQQQFLATVDLKLRMSHLVDTIADVMLRLGEPPKSAQLN